jgi:hypothetical protein
MSIERFGRLRTASASALRSVLDRSWSAGDGDDSCIETFLHVHVEGIPRLTSPAVCIFLCHLTDVDEIHIIIHTQMHIFKFSTPGREWDPHDELQSVVVATPS